MKARAACLADALALCHKDGSSILKSCPGRGPRLPPRRLHRPKPLEERLTSALWIPSASKAVSSSLPSVYKSSSAKEIPLLSTSRSVWAGTNFWGACPSLWEMSLEQHDSIRLAPTTNIAQSRSRRLLLASPAFDRSECLSRLSGLVDVLENAHRNAQSS